MRVRLLAFGSAYLALATVLPAADGTSAEKPAAEPAASPAEKAEEKSAPTCHERFLALQILHDSIPKSFGGLREEALKQVQQTVDKLIADCEALRKDCPDAPEKPWVTYFLAYSLGINSQRWYYGLPQEMPLEEKLKSREAYFERIHTLLREVLAAKDVEKRLRMLTEYQVGQVFYNLRKSKELAEHYAEFIKKYPEYPDLDLVHLTISRAHADAGKWADAEKWTKMSLEKFPRSRYSPHFGNHLVKVYTGNGKLEHLAKYWEENEAVYRKRAKDPETQAEARPDFEQFADWSKYWVPFAYFALGEFDKARKLYREGLDFLLNKKEKEGVSQATDVFIGRIQTDLDVIENLVEMPAPPWELDWVSKERPSLKDCVGRAVIIVFRSYEWERVNDMLVHLDEIYQDFGGPAGSLEVLTITWYKGMRDLDAQRALVSTEAEKLGLHYGVGIEPSEEKPVHRAYKADVGGSTIVAIDPFGRVVWYKQDPMPHDFGTVRRVIDRIAQ